MKRLTKALCFLLACTLLLAMSSGLAVAQGGVSLDGSLPIVTDASQVQPLRVALRMRGGNVLTANENPQALRVLADTGVPVEWIEIPETGSAEKVGLMLASDDYPDIFLNGLVPVSMISQYIGMDVFMPMDDLIDAYMPRLSTVLSQRPDYAAALPFADGAIYSLPYIEELMGLTLSGGGFGINQAWLDQLGLSMPTTVDEFQDVLLAFKNAGDLNGNGLDDEVAFACDFVHSNSFGGTQNPVWTFTSCFADGTRLTASDSYPFLNASADGTISFAANTDSFRECLKFFNELYTQGLIEDNAFSTDAYIADKTKGDVAIYGVYQLWNPHIAYTNADVQAQYVPMTPLEGEGGLWSNVANRTEMSNKAGTVLTTACQQPELAAAWLDYQYDPEISFTSNWGAVGNSPEDELRFTYDETGYIRYTRNAEGKTISPEWCAAGAIRWSSTIFSQAGSAVLSEYFASVGEIDPNAQFTLDWQLVNGKEAMMALYGDNVVPAHMTLGEDDAALYAQLLPQIENLVRGYLVSAILDGNVDGTWDAYVASLEAAGVASLVQCVQGAYDLYLANMN